MPVQSIIEQIGRQIPGTISSIFDMIDGGVIRVDGPCNNKEEIIEDLQHTDVVFIYRDYIRK